jgi:inorganic pyrophosphatase
MNLLVSFASFASFPTFDPESGDVLAIVETPKGSRNKYSFNEKLGAFELKKVLPQGMMFPYDFGFIPSTRSEDGDPLDILVLMDQPAPMGCVIRSRLIGSIEAEQKGAGAWERNDRLIGVANHARLHGAAKSLDEINPRILDEIEAFFQQYNQIEGRKFRVVRRCGPKKAMKLLEKGRRDASSTGS